MNNPLLISWALALAIVTGGVVTLRHRRLSRHAIPVPAPRLARLSDVDAASAQKGATRPAHPVLDPQSESASSSRGHRLLMREMLKKIAARHMSSDPMNAVELAQFHQLARLSPAEMELVLEDSVSCSEDLSGTFLAGCLEMLSQNYPQASISLLQKYHARFQSDAAQKSATLLHALQMWGRTDASAALTWLRHPAHAELVDDALRADFLASLAGQNVELALAHAGGESPAAISKMVEHLPSAAWHQLLAALPDSGATAAHRADLFQAATKQLLADSAATAIKWLSEAPLSPAEKGTIARSVAQQLTHQSAQPWLEWVAQSLPASPEKSVAMRSLVDRWAEQDYNGAGAWINLQPPGQEKNEAIHAYASRLSAAEPAAAYQWALQLPDSPARQQLLHSINAGSR